MQTFFLDLAESLLISVCGNAIEWTPLLWNFVIIDQFSISSAVYRTTSVCLHNQDGRLADSHIMRNATVAS